MQNAQTDFCTDWLFEKSDADDGHAIDCDDALWQRVNVPHTWNAIDMAPGQPRKEAYVGPSWYRKHFLLQPAEGKRYLLHFEGVSIFSEVWVDGKFIGGYDGGFLGFRFDITDTLEPGEKHVVAVKADNGFRPGTMPPEILDWERYGGMYRPVWLEERSSAYFEYKSLQIKTPVVSEQKAELTASVRIMEWGTPKELSVRYRLHDADGNEVSTISDTIATSQGRCVEHAVAFDDIHEPKLWSVDRPYLYTLETTLIENGKVIDSESQAVGFRWFNFDPDTGFSLNGKSLKLLGVNCHQDFPGLGNACPDRFHRRDIELMKEAGINFLRTSHYPRNECALNYCDRMGILVMEEQPFWHGSLQSLHGEALGDYARRMMRDMVKHHGNHPCIIAWNTVNEVMLKPDDPDYHAPPEEKWKRRRLEREEWPYARRMLSLLYDTLKETDCSRPVSMIIGGSHKLNEEAGLTKLADMVGYNGGAFHAEVEGRPLYDLHKEGDPERIVFMSEGILNIDPPMRGEWEKELTFWETPAKHWSRIYERDWLCGGAMWVFADYSAKGTYRTRGMVDYSRLPLESYYFFQSQWTESLMAQICCHWDWDVAEGEERRVIVFTNGDDAELFLNGESLGIGVPNKAQWPLLPHPPVEWHVPFAPGELKVVVRRGEESVSDVRLTSGDLAAIRLEVEDPEVLADGRDVAFFTATLIDKQGRRCYRAPDTVLQVEVTGQGIATIPTEFIARGGLAQFAVRSTVEPGEIIVKTAAEDLGHETISKIKSIRKEE